MKIEPMNYDSTVPPIATILEYTGMSVGGLIACGCWPGITEECDVLFIKIQTLLEKL